MTYRFSSQCTVTALAAYPAPANVLLGKCRISHINWPFPVFSVLALDISDQEMGGGRGAGRRRLLSAAVRLRRRDAAISLHDGGGPDRG
jgi:hypothetical protein